ncbi:MAG: hypothetical protein LH606_09000, partial [Cytophagaceae bacterium]|nr:hypothetical protein [Cytophagaceae bacterium]
APDWAWSDDFFVARPLIKIHSRRSATGKLVLHPFSSALTKDENMDWSDFLRNRSDNKPLASPQNINSRHG